jgi:hypothetical protein
VVKGAISIVGGANGANKKVVTVKGDGCGLARLKAAVRGEELTIDLKVLERAEIKVSIVIVRSRAGIPTWTDEEARALVAKLDPIFEQVAMHFKVEGEIQYEDNDDLLTVDLATEGAALRGKLHDTGGVELYLTRNLVPALVFGENGNSGIIVAKTDDPRILAHEIGHACNLKDIYIIKGTVATPDELVKEEWEPNDWNSGLGPRFYSPVLRQRALVARLLMLGQPWDGGHADIPLGRIYGVRYYSGLSQPDLTWVPVGLLDDWNNEYMNRNPHHE